MSNLSIEKLRDIKANFGGWKRYAHPAMRIYTRKLDGFNNWNRHYLFDLEQTFAKLKNMKNKLQEIDQAGKKILFVATSKNLKGIIGNYIKNTNHFFVENRWLGGTLTNFNSIQKQIFLLQKMYSKENKGTTNLLTKKEKMLFQKKKIFLENNLKGILEMNKLPDYLFIVDPHSHAIVVKEAQKLKIPILTFLKTNENPNLFEEFVPINDGSAEVLKNIMQDIVENNLEEKTIILQTKKEVTLENNNK